MKIMSFFRLSWRQKLGFLINFTLCGIARAAINLFNYRTLRPYFGYAWPCKLHPPYYQRKISTGLGNQTVY